MNLCEKSLSLPLLVHEVHKDLHFVNDDFHISKVKTFFEKLETKHEVAYESEHILMRLLFELNRIKYGLLHQRYPISSLIISVTKENTLIGFFLSALLWSNEACSITWCSL